MQTQDQAAQELDPHAEPRLASHGTEDNIQDIRDLLLRIAQEMADVRDLDQLLQRIVDTALRVAPSAEKAVIHLIDRSGDALVARYCSQPSLIRDQQRGIARGVGLMWRALGDARILCVNDTRLEPGFAPLRSGPELRSMLVAPMMVQGEELGTLSLNSPVTAAFDDWQVSYISALAAQASVAIHQANLVRQAVAQRQRSEAIIETISDGLVIVDQQQMLRRANPALQQMIELPCLPPMPCPLSDIVVLERVLDPSGGEVMGSYGVEFRRDGQPAKTLLVSMAALSEPEDSRLYIVRDISAERAAAEERSLFISQVSHELRTPLQHILGFVSLITDLEDIPPEDQRQFLGHIEDETYHMTRQVDDLIALSRIETGRFSIFGETVFVNEMLQDVASRLAPRARFKDIDLELHGPQELVFLETDPVRVEQVITNLVENACKFVEPGGRVVISAEADTRELVIHVRDTGSGIPQDKLDLIFAAFYQVSGANARHVGLGLGLHISQQIVQALGGRIWVTSKVGEGSTFSFSLPGIQPSPLD